MEGHLARRQLYNRSTTPLELPGTDWGGDPPPPTGNERERERERERLVTLCEIYSGEFAVMLGFVLFDVSVLSLYEKLNNYPVLDSCASYISCIVGGRSVCRHWQFL